MIFAQIGRGRWGLAGLLLVAAAFVPSLVRSANDDMSQATIGLREDPRLSVMTYNIEGLPWPVRSGRTGAFDRIGARLNALRASGGQPHIVTLQEAFSADAKRIGITSGYRYIANGPDKTLAGARAVLPADIAFAAKAHFLDGERSGKLLDSGLQILSDYPIVAVRRMAFPSYACAGYDCLANKGALVAMIAVPGIAEPIAVVNAHLNSRTASGVGDQRTLYAYERQIDALDAFIAEAIRPGTPMIVAGDFNVGPVPSRLGYFAAHFSRWGVAPRAAPVSDALRSCYSDAKPCGGSLPADSGTSLQLARDWQLSVPGTRHVLAVRGLAVPFGHDRDGKMLSDHIGYVAYYDVAANAPASVRVAAASGETACALRPDHCQESAKAVR